MRASLPVHGARWHHGEIPGFLGSLCAASTQQSMSLGDEVSHPFHGSRLAFSLFVAANDGDGALNDLGSRLCDRNGTSLRLAAMDAV